jgi:murein DD-endopeptidase MepM/ murein hydrolase activator NlpD
MTGALLSCSFGFISNADATIESEFHFVQIILLHRRLARARTLTLTNRQIALLIALVLLVFVLLAAGIAALALRYAGQSKLPVVKSLLDAGADDDAARKDRNTRENLNAMAVKLGEMQARMMRLDALGDRVSGLAGINPQDFDFKSPPARGGMAPSNARALTMNELRTELDRVALDVEHRSDFLDAVETELISATLKSKMMPTIQPVDVTYNASGFGWRIDPFTGAQAMHQGIDFVAATGTPIVAAAGGVVIAAEWHHDFGNMIEIDHGNDITTLYAHTSKVYVRVGDIVKRNQHIADVGSTGRATGSHLHFEVHVKNVPQNPDKFLHADRAPTSRRVAATR